MPKSQTPKSSTKRKAASSEPSPTPTPRKKVKKEVVPAQSLARDDRAAVPIDVTFEGEAVAGAVKDGRFGLTLKLEGLGAFSLVKTVTFICPCLFEADANAIPQLVFTEGEFEGNQAIILKPAKAFPFLRLPENIRQIVYKVYFAANGIIGKEIVLEGRRTNKDIYAKSYSEGSKNRVALLAASNSIYDEAVPVLYNHALKLESTTAVVDFMAQCRASMKTRLQDVEIKNWVKTQSRIAMHNLSNAVNIRRLHIDAGVSSDGDPVKAAKVFYTDASKFLEAVSGKSGEKGAGVDVLSFGKQALTSKEGKSAQPWSDTMKEEFMAELKARMR